jgi:hypothetical protein
MTLSIMTFISTTLSIVAICINVLVCDTKHNKTHHAKCRVSFMVKLNVVMLGIMGPHSGLHSGRLHPRLQISK